jgi:hypothetical protein
LNARLGKFFTGFISAAPKQQINIDAENLINEERQSRDLYCAKIKALASDKLFEHFVVTGLEAPINLDLPNPTPKVLFQYPQDPPLSIQSIETFCYPEGVPEGKIRNQEDNTFVFLITTEEDEQLYGISLYKTFSVEAYFKATQLDSLSPTKGVVTNTTSIESTRCYTFISKYPFIHFLIELLERISLLENRLTSPFDDDDYQEPVLRRGNTVENLTSLPAILPSISQYDPQPQHFEDCKKDVSQPTLRHSTDSFNLDKENGFDFEKQESLFIRPDEGKGQLLPGKKKVRTPKQILLHTLAQIRNIKKPEAGQQLVVHFPKSIKPVKFTREPPKEELEGLLGEWGLLWLFKAFYNTKNFETILSAILLEKKVLFVCPNIRKLSSIVLAWTILVRPFHYQSKVIPILSSTLESFLEAPCPFLIGMLKRPSEIPSDVVVVQIQDGSLTVKEPIPSLRCLFTMRKKLEPLYKDLERTYRESNYWPTDEQKPILAEMRALLQDTIDESFKSFNQHTIRDLTNPAKPITVFLKDSFLCSLPTRDSEFFTVFLGTQIFFQYCDQKVRSRDESGH